MGNVIILAVLVMIILLASKSSLKHFRGEGSCCGGSGDLVKPEKKRLENPVVGKISMEISGMHCSHCKDRVEAALNEIEGVCAKVSLKNNQAIVKYDREISSEVLKKAVETAGYQVTSISKAA